MRTVALLTVILAGCTSSPRTSQPFEEEPGRVYEAARKALKDYPVLEADADRGIIRTGWGPELLGEPLTPSIQGNHWRVRLKYDVQIGTGPEGVQAHVCARMKRRAPGGTRALRWERVRSGGKPEEALLRTIREALQP